MIRRSCPVLMLAFFMAGCGDEEPSRNWNAFVDLANQSSCANLRNRVLVIDQSVVLIDQAGSCNDASYRQVLYGETVSDVLCTLSDSIAGPQKTCRVASYAEMFNIMVAHLADRDLGLGATYKIQQVK